MHRNGTENARDSGRKAERDASQSLGEPARDDDENDDEGVEGAGQVPSFLTASELQAREPARVERRSLATEGGSEPRNPERRSTGKSQR